MIVNCQLMALAPDEPSIMELLAAIKGAPIIPFLSERIFVGPISEADQSVITVRETSKITLVSGSGHCRV
jgi:hypothetical protein